MKPKECREDINIFRKWANHRYKLIKIISKGRSAKSLKGSGAHVFKIKDTHSNRDYILKYYNALKSQTRNYRDMYVSCRLSGLKGVPRVIAQGKTILPKQYGAKLQKNTFVSKPYFQEYRYQTRTLSSKTKMTHFMFPSRF